jgi:NADPH:quinone reductase-like Zn-dependent oxidoreductase
VLTLEDVAPGVPGHGEVRLRVQAFGLNNSEAQYRRGEYPLRNTDFPTRIGRECAGTVEALGPGVDDFRVGDEVSTIPLFDVQRGGVYGDWAVVPAAALERMPSRLPRIECAAVWQAYLTAYAPFVEYAALAAGDWVLITAAASSVGRAAMQVARELGCRVIATTRSAKKATVLADAGAERVVVTSAEPLAGAVHEATRGAGAKLVFDPIAGAIVPALCDAAASGALLVLYGRLDASLAEYPVITCLRKGLTLRGYTLWEVTLDPARRRRACDWIKTRLGDGRLTPAIDRVFSLEDVVEAHRYLESGEQLGKIVVRTWKSCSSPPGTPA